MTRGRRPDDRGIGSQRFDRLVEIGEHRKAGPGERGEAAHRRAIEVDDADQHHLLVVRGGERVHEADAPGTDEDQPAGLDRFDRALLGRTATGELPDERLVGRGVHRLERRDAVEVGLADRRREVQLRHQPHAEAGESERHGDGHRLDPEAILGLTANQLAQEARRRIAEGHEVRRVARSGEGDQRVGEVVHADRLGAGRAPADDREHPELRRGLRGASHEPVVRVAVHHAGANDDDIRFVREQLLDRVLRATVRRRHPFVRGLRREEDETADHRALRDLEEPFGADAIHRVDDVRIGALRCDREMHDDVDVREHGRIGPRRQLEEVTVGQGNVRFALPGPAAERRDVVAGLERARREVPSDETGRAGDRDPQEGSFSHRVRLTTRRPVGR